LEIGALLASINPGDVGFGALLALAIYLVLTGKIVPRSVVDDIRADRDARVATANEEKSVWREVAETSDKRADVLSGQVGQLLEYARVSDHLLRSIKESAEDGK